jgi:hypothetical protein
MCYILCTTRCSVCYVASGMQGGLMNFFPWETCHIFASFLCHLDFCVHCWVVFRHMVFADGFLFPVKELGLLTNPSHWVRVLDAVGSYMYIVL